MLLQKQHPPTQRPSPAAQVRPWWPALQRWPQQLALLHPLQFRLASRAFRQLRRPLQPKLTIQRCTTTKAPNAYWSRTGYAAFQFTNWLPNYIFTVSIDNYATKVKVPVDATGYAEIQLPWEGDFHVYYTFPGISAGTTGWGWDMTSPELAASATTGSTATLAATDPVPTQGLWRYSSGPWSLSLTNGCDLVAAGHGAGADCTWTDLANAAALKTPYTFYLADLDESVAYALRLEDGAGMDTFAAAQKLSGTAGETLTSTELTNMVAGSGAVFSLADGSVLPDGLALDTATGEISGTPTAAAETSTVAINATLSGGSAQLAGLINLTIAPAPALLNYVGNGGEGSVASVTGVTGDGVTLADNGFVYNGYEFTGWDTSADGSGTDYAAGAHYTLNGTTTLYAQWAASPAVLNYDGNGGEGTVDPEAGVTNEHVSIADNGFNHDGYEFTGWNTEADGSGDAYAAGDDYTLFGDTTLYAQWEEVAAPVVEPTPEPTAVVPGAPTPDGVAVQTGGEASGVAGIGLAAAALIGGAAAMIARKRRN